MTEGYSSLVPGGAGYRKPYQTVNGKSEHIKKAIDDKNEGIKKFTAAKVSSIQHTASLRDAGFLATTELAIGKLEHDKYWERYEQLYQKFLAYQQNG